jgi:hypothetical protein
MFGRRSAAVFGSRRLIGLDSVFVPVRFLMVIFRVRLVSFCSAIGRRGGRLNGSRIGQRHRRQRLARLNIAMVVIKVIVLIVSMFMIVRGTLMMITLMIFRIRVVIFGVVVAFAVRVLHGFWRVFLAFHPALSLIGLSGQRRIWARVLDDLALDALATAAAARVAVARTAAIGAVFALLLGLSMGAFIRFDQGLAIGDRNLIIVGMNFAEGQKAVAVAAVLDEGCLQRRLYASDLGEIDVAAQLLALGGLEIKFFDAIAADHDDPGLFRVGGIDQHLVGHFGALDGGGRGAWRAQIAPPGDATVHLIRG